MEAKEQSEAPLQALDQQTINLLYHEARKMVLRPPFTRSDLEDIKQELVLNAMVVARKYDRNRGKFSTFMRLSARSHFSAMCRKHTTQKNDWRKHQDLSDDARSNDHYINELRTDPCGIDHDAIDILTVIENHLSEPLREIAIALMQCGSTREVSRKLGITRFKLEKKCEQIAEIFERHGIGKIF